MGRRGGRRFGAVGSAPSFSPDSIGSLKLWLSADVGVTQSGGFVDAWANRASLGGSFTGLTTTRPAYTASLINGRPGITFDGVDDAMTSPLTLSQIITNNAYTGFYVVRNRSTQPVQLNSYQNDAVLIDSAGFWGMLLSSTVAVAYNWDGTDDSARPAAAPTANYLLFHQLSGGTLTANVNAGADSTKATGAVTTLTGTMRLGFASGVSFNLEGDICEVLVFNAALSAGDIASVRAYLLSRWGL